MVWDDAAELFVATSTVGRRVSGIEVDGAVAWETVLDGPIAGLASAPEGVLVTFLVGDVGWTSMLGADGTPVWEMGFPSAVGEVRSSPGNRAFALEERYDGDLHVFVWPSG